MEKEVPKCLAEIQVESGVARRNIDLTVFTVPVVKLVRDEIEKSSTEIAELDRKRNVSSGAALRHMKRS